jgi:general secretion pathway protein J
MFTASGHTGFSGKPDSGFTLLEILIAITVFAIIITTVFGSHNYVFSSAKAVEEDMAAYEMAKVCLSRITHDLGSLHVRLSPEYTLPDLDDGEDPFKISGQTVDEGNESFSRLLFASRAHVSLEKNFREGIARIAYYVQKSHETGYVLRRSDKLYPYEPFEEKKSDPVLCENVKSLVFKYYDDQGDEYESWDSDSADVDYSTPGAIKITLEIGNDTNFSLFETMIKLPVFRKKIEHKV